MKRKLQRGTAVFEKMSSTKAVRRPFTGFSEASGHLRKTGKRASIGIRPERELNLAPIEQPPKTATVTIAPSKLI